MPKKPETLFKERVAKDLKTLPFTWFVKIQQKTIRGIPDYILCVNGHFIALELKSDGGIVNELQRWTLECISHANGSYFVATRENWIGIFEEIKTLINEDMEPCTERKFQN